jgi:hypothetical protein
VKRKFIAFFGKERVFTLHLYFSFRHFYRENTFSSGLIDLKATTYNLPFPINSRSGIFLIPLLSLSAALRMVLALS